MKKIIVKGGRLFDPAEGLNGIFDIYIEEGTIKDIGESLNYNDSSVLDASGLYVFPGFIDLHAHFREPGEEYKEDLESGSRAALYGGYTTVFVMPNTTPPIDNHELVSYIRKRSDEIGLVDIYPVGAISKGRRGEELAEMGFMSERGARAFSDDGSWVQDSSLMRRALEYSSFLGSFVITHAEDETLSKGGVAHECEFTYRLGLKGIPRESEDYAVMRDIMLASLTGGRLHIAHISSKNSVEIVNWAKKRGINVTAEVTPHHLLLTVECLKNYDTNAKVKPPLREEDDRVALLNALNCGVIDVIATDHAPHAQFEKLDEFFSAPFGIMGIELSFSLLYTKLVLKGKLSLERLIEALTSKPAEIGGFKDRGRIRRSFRADLCLFDLDSEREIKPPFKSKASNTPFIGEKVKGELKYAIKEGRIIKAEDI